MSHNVQKLYEISRKEQRSIIGLMSGTSLDGLDVALCTFQGIGSKTQIVLKQFKTVPYTSETKGRIASVFSKQDVKLQDICLLNPWIGLLHAEIVLDCLREWNVSPSEIDIIASHGQTIYHAPKSFHGIEAYPNSTLQIGDGDHIAVKTGVITVSDFRQKHIAGGGEGAPLALYGDFLIFSQQGENRIMLNIGGISNITCLFGDLDPKKAFATDLGPGNTLIDAYVRAHFGLDFDKDGEIAAKGEVNPALLQMLKKHPFFSLPCPKTTGCELFNLVYVENAQKTSQMEGISQTSVVATLTRLTAEIIADGIMKSVLNGEPFRVYSSGGGAHNPVLMKHLRTLLPDLRIENTDKLGIPGDAKEAVLFATLANEAIAGESKIDFGQRRDIPSISMGKISFPT